MAAVLVTLAIAAFAVLFGLAVLLAVAVGPALVAHGLGAPAR